MLSKRMLCTAFLFTCVPMWRFRFSLVYTIDFRNGLSNRRPQPGFVVR